MNSCHFIGRLVENPDLQSVTKDDGGETSVVNFDIAITRRFKRNNGETGQQTVILPCEAWDSGAQVIARHFSKGDSIIIKEASARSETVLDETGTEIFKVVFRIQEFDSIVNHLRRRPREKSTTDE